YRRLVDGDQLRAVAATEALRQIVPRIALRAYARDHTGGRGVRLGALGGLVQRRRHQLLGVVWAEAHAAVEGALAARAHRAGGARALGEVRGGHQRARIVGAEADPGVELAPAGG